MTSAILVRDLTVNRGHRIVLHQLNLKVATGTVTGLIGPSGSGKTTLIRALAGVQSRVQGTVEVLGAAAGSRVNRSRLTYLTQGGSVYPDLTADQNVRHFARLSGIDPVRAKEALARVDLADRGDQLVSEMSGGQRARVGLASVLVTGAEVMLLDEPTVGLDPVLREQLWALFGSLAAEGTTLLGSSHVMDEAARCDRVLFLRDGHFLADDTPDGLRTAAGTNDLDEAFVRLARRGGDV